jgi:tRNA(fMet)-specific endonuclease VapC
MSYFLDTNTCIYAIKKKTSIAGHLARIKPENIKIPIIVKAELRFGCEKSHRKELNRLHYEAFLASFETITMDDAATFHYARIRAYLEAQGSPIGPNDLLIASIVMSKGGILVTHNTGEFSRIQGLLLEDWTV